MSFCCENPIDLGCRSACAPLTLPIAIVDSGYYTIVYDFAGALISREFEAIPVGGFLQVPAYIFNETQNVTFQIYDNSGVLISCFKAHILPSNMVTEPYTPTPPLLPFTTSITFTGAGCANDVYRGVMTITFTPDAGVQDGTILDLHHDILHNNIATPHSIICNTNGVDYIGDDLIITDASLLTNNEILLDVQVTSKNCNHSFTIDAVIDHVENLASGYENTTNTPMTQFVWH